MSSGAGSGQSVASAAAPGVSTPSVSIPSTHEAYMRNAARAMDLTKQLTEGELSAILKNSYSADPSLRGISLQADLETRAKPILTYKQFPQSFWEKVKSLLGETHTNTMIGFLHDLSMREDKRDYKIYKNILTQLQNNEQMYASDIRDPFIDPDLDRPLGRLIIALVQKKQSQGVTFGGKRKRSHKKSSTYRHRGRGHKSTKRHRRS